jgi:hypothetical protein
VCGLLSTTNYFSGITSKGRFDTRHSYYCRLLLYSQELSSFVDQPDIITHVATVKPKPGVFIDEISFLLVICTPVSVLLIGLSTAPVPGSSNRPHKDIRLYATDMSIATEIEMSSVIGTKDGRIFMCGSQDGNLYELHYQEKEGWFGKRVQLINHSVGSVQSLFPRFSAPSSEGQWLSLNIYFLSPLSSQTASSPLFRTYQEIASIHYPEEMAYPHIDRTAKSRLSIYRPSQTSTNQRRKRLQAHQVLRPKIST